MPPPTWVAGQVLAAADVNSWFVPLVAVKGTNQSVTSSTILVNDTALFVPLAANATYYFQMFLDHEGGTAGASDLKFQLLVPTGATLRGVANYRSTSGLGVTWNEITGVVSVTAGTNGAGNALGLTVFGTVIVSSTSGNLQLEWAQGTSSGTATIVHAQSVLMAYRIS